MKLHSHNFFEKFFEKASRRWLSSSKKFFFTVAMLHPCNNFELSSSIHEVVLFLNLYIIYCFSKTKMTQDYNITVLSPLATSRIFIHIALPLEHYKSGNRLTELKVILSSYVLMYVELID